MKESSLNRHNYIVISHIYNFIAISHIYDFEIMHFNNFRYTRDKMGNESAEERKRKVKY